MNHSQTKIFLALVFLISASTALADGMLLTAPYYYIDENSQQAIIQYDADAQTETISILPGFQGDATEFAWILPMPNLPAVAEEDPFLFRQMLNFTRPQTRYRDGDWDGCNSSYDDYAQPLENGVDIISNQMVGYYQTMTLAADQAPALIDSLALWGFLHTENVEQATELINGYVEQDWYFVTVKVDSASFAETFPDHDYYGYYGYYSGHLEPLKFTFSSDEIIYPMRISALSAAESTQLDLYVVANHRTTFPGAYTRYANAFDEVEINNINGRSYPLVKGLFASGDFLTHLRRDFRPQDMTEDIVIVPAENNEEFWMIYYSGFPWMTLLFLGPPIIWGLYRKMKNKVQKTLNPANP